MNMNDNTLKDINILEKEKEDISETKDTTMLMHWKKLEKKYETNLYMSKQPEINSSYRAIAVGTIIKAHILLELEQETLYLSISIFDRFASKRVIKKKLLHLVIYTSLFIASKYVEDMLLYLSDYMDVFSKVGISYSKNQIIYMEEIILETLNFDFIQPTSFTFLNEYYNLINMKPEGFIYNLTNYYLELTLQSYNLLKYPPSYIAITSLLLAYEYNSELIKMKDINFLISKIRIDKEDIKSIVNEMKIIILFHNGIRRNIFTTKTGF